MKIKAIILNLVAFIGLIGSFYLAGLNAFGVWPFVPGEYSFSIPGNDPISQAFDYLSPAANLIFYGLLFSAVVLSFCSAIAVALKLKVVTNGYGIAFVVPRESTTKARE